MKLFSRLQQRKMAQYCVSIFGDMLLDKPIDDFPVRKVAFVHREFIIFPIDEYSCFVM